MTNQTQNPFTRQDYLSASKGDGMEAHRRYYAQFVTPTLVESVAKWIGKERLLASTDASLNDIPLKEWDRCGEFLCNTPSRRDLMKQLGDWMTLSGLTCIAKEAAKQFIEQETR